MEYFPPKSFINWGTPTNQYLRLGTFKISPVNNQYNNELYWCFSSLLDNGKFQTFMKNSGVEWRSPKFCSEEQAVRWLESKLKTLTYKKVNQANKELLKTISNNKRFIKTMNG